MEGMDRIVRALRWKLWLSCAGWMIFSCARSGFQETPTPCLGIDCSGHGRCEVVDGRAVCSCDPGFRRDGDTSCLEGFCAGDRRFGDEDGDGSCGCAEFSAFSDNFDDGVMGPGWMEMWHRGNAGTAEEDGRLAISLSPAPSPSEIAYYVSQPFALEGDSVWVTLVQGTDRADVESYFGITAATSGWLQSVRFSQIGRTLSFLQKSADTWTSLGYVDYDPSAPLHLRITQSSGVISFVSSLDGYSWTEQITFPSSDQGYYAHIGAGTKDPFSATATVRFDDFNVGSGSGGSGALLSCPASELTDSFDDDTPSWVWFPWANNGAEVDETQGALQITFGSPGAATRFAGYTSRRHYDLRGQRVSVALPGTVSAQSTASQIFEVDLRQRDGSSQQNQLILRQGTLTWNQGTEPASPAVLGTAPYQPTSQRYLALREAQGVLFFEVSADGRDWTTLCSAPAPTSVADAVFLLWASTDPTTTNPGIARFDDFNIH